MAGENNFVSSRNVSRNGHGNGGWKCQACFAQKALFPGDHFCLCGQPAQMPGGRQFASRANVLWPLAKCKTQCSCWTNYPLWRRIDWSCRKSVYTIVYSLCMPHELTIICLFRTHVRESFWHTVLVSSCSTSSVSWLSSGTTLCRWFSYLVFPTVLELLFVAHALMCYIIFCTKKKACWQ